MFHAGERLARPKPDSIATKAAMSAPAYRRYLDTAATMPPYLESPAWLAVHGAVVNGLPLHEQPEKVLTGEITLDPSWKDFLDLDRPLIVGHKRYSKTESDPYIVEGKFYGIDTGCVYGGASLRSSCPKGGSFRGTTPPSAHVDCMPSPDKRDRLLTAIRSIPEHNRLHSVQQHAIFET